LGSVGQLPPGELAIHAATLFGTAILNVVLSGLLFSLLMSRYGKVGLLEMQALIASATLLNFVPMRPGLFGRIAYHRMYNQIAVTHSATVIVQAVCLSAAIAGYVIIAVVLSLKCSINLWILISVPLPILAAGAATIKGLRPWLCAAGVRYLDLLVTAGPHFPGLSVFGLPTPPPGGP